LIMTKVIPKTLMLVSRPMMMMLMMMMMMMMMMMPIGMIRMKLQQ